MERARSSKEATKGGGSVVDFQPARKLSDWLEGFADYTSDFGSPDIFTKWAGIATIAGALERKVWTVNTRGALFPNLYTILVGPPGVGKSLATGEGAAPLFSELKDHFLGATSVSRASLTDNLAQAERRIVNPKGITSFHALMIISNELGSLLSAYDGDFMSLLTDIYDGRKFEEKKRTRDLHIQMDRPCLNYIAATTPSFLNDLLPAGAWDQGFLSRCNLIYSGEQKVVDLWAVQEKNEKLFNTLVADLRRIGDLFGEIRVADDVRVAFMNWVRAGAEPKPEHPKLAHYNTRRPAHLLKLCMIASASRGDDLMITLDDYRTALGWLIEAETFMPDIFKAMNTGGDSNAIRDTWYFVQQIFMKTKKPVPDYKVVHFISERVPAHSVVRVVETMVRMRLLEETHVAAVGKCYVPRAKDPH